MLKYVARRLLLMVGIVFVISVGSFYLIHLLPGIPGHGHPGLRQHPGGQCRPLQAAGPGQAHLPAVLHLDGPRDLRGNLGISFITHTSIAGTIRAALPIDLEIIVISQILAFAVAIPMAMRSARKPDGIVDRILGAGSFTLLSVPPSSSSCSWSC